MDARTVDDLMHQEVQRLTANGQRQEGLVLICQEHGVQPFEAFYHPPVYQPALQLGCGCTFFARESGEIVQVKP
jgi:hypothetical protein